MAGEGDSTKADASEKSDKDEANGTQNITKQVVKQAPPIENPHGPHNDLVLIDIKQFDGDGWKK